MSDPVPVAPRNGDPQADQLGEPVTGERLSAEPAANGSSPAGTTSTADVQVHITVPKLKDEPSTAEVVQVAIASAISTFFEHDQLAANGDVRGVHQARVGLRRLRSHLRTFRRVIDTEWAAALSAEASWFADSLGQMRDLDVLNGRLLQGAMLQVPEHAPAIATLVTMLDDERDDALNRHRQLRATARYTGLAVRLEEAANDMPSRGRGSEPADSLLPRLLLRTWHDLRNAARVERRENSVEHLHTVRIRAKRLRYACEASTAVLGPDAKTTAKAAEALQERLGEWHDACAARDWLEHAGTVNTKLSEVAKRLAILENRAAAVAAKKWDSEFREVKKGWKLIDSASRKNRSR
ncbi:MAG: CHAD domain-containing protein [Acidimicrobiales bacterium]